MRQIKKMMQRGLLDPEKEDPFSLFVASTNIRYCFYHDTHKILGNTFGMCVLQVRKACGSLFLAWLFAMACMSAALLLPCPACLRRTGQGCMHPLTSPSESLVEHALIITTCRQDFEALTPNLLARTMETVEGGGIVVLLLSSMSSLTQLYNLTMDVHARFRTESHQEVVGEPRQLSWHTRLQ